MYACMYVQGKLYTNKNRCSTFVVILLRASKFCVMYFSLFFRSWESLMVVWIYFRNIVSPLKLAKTFFVETQTEACKCLKTYILIRILYTTKLITWPISLRFPPRIWCWHTYQKAGFWMLLYGWSVNIKLFWKMNLT